MDNIVEKAKVFGILEVNMAQISTLIPLAAGGVFACVSMLDISDQNLEICPPLEKGKWNELKELYLEKNKLKTLTRGLGTLRSLTRLDLHNNLLESIPEEIGELNNLSELSLFNNKLTTLPSSLRNLVSLQILDLRNNKLESLPPFELKNSRGNGDMNGDLSDINESYMVNLRELYLQSNSLSSLPSGFSVLENLEILNLCSNEFEEVPIAIMNQNSLRELDLKLNKITKISPGIGKMWNLRGLYLSFNKLKELPEEIGLLSFLERLYLNFNYIVTLPPKISTITSLVRLDLKGNPLEPPLKKKLREDGTKALIQYLRAEAAKLTHSAPIPLSALQPPAPTETRKKSTEKQLARSPSEPVISSRPKRTILDAFAKIFSSKSNAQDLGALPPRPASFGNINDISHSDRATIGNLPPPPNPELSHQTTNLPKALKRISSLQPSALPIAPHSINPRRQSLPSIRPKTKQLPNAEAKLQGQLTLLEQKENQFQELKSSYAEVDKVVADTMSQDDLIIKANDLTKRIALLSEFMVELLKQREILKLDKTNNDNFVADLIKSIEQH